jgi:PAS domain S-box-containing protein
MDTRYKTDSKRSGFSEPGIKELCERISQYESDRGAGGLDHNSTVQVCSGQYHAMLDNVDAQMSLLDRNMTVIWANRNTRELFGREIIGSSCSGVCYGERGSCPEQAACIVKKAFHQGSEQKHEIEVITAQGKRMFFRGAARIITRDHNKRPLTVLRIYTDITEQKKTELELKESMLRLRKNLAGTIQAMAMTVETRDPYTAGHQKKTADIARTIAQEMGLPQKQVDGIRMAGVIHDLGKISIPAEILSKPGRICKPEYSLIQYHPQTGYDILKGIDFRWPVAEIVRQHHERMDGSGYPYGLAGDEILLEARIIGVADVIEAMSSHRPYRPALGINMAFREIRQNKGRLYDRDVVDAAVRVFAKTEFQFH